MPKGVSYDAVCADFAWDIPDDLNMAHEVCDRWAENDPNRIALIVRTDGNRSISFSELRAMADRLAAHLQNLGVKRGDRVGVLRRQSLWTAAGHIAIWKLGAVSLPLSPLFATGALSSRLSDAQAECVITDVAGGARLKALDLNITPVFPEDAPEAGRFETAKTGPETPACLIYTSGTTGAPKGALHGHRVLHGHRPGVEMSHDGGFEAGDILWTPADWAWIGGLFDVLMPGLAAGIPVVAGPAGKFDASETKQLCETLGVTCVFFPPSALKMLRASGVSIEGLRTVASGGEPLGSEMLHWGERALGLRINEFYGQTEANMIVSSCAKLFAPHPGVTGRAVPGHCVCVVDETGTPTDGEGDIAVHRDSPVVMLEYLNRAEATRDKFRGDWLITGDRGVMTDGMIKFIARDDDVITSAGYRIGPSEIEDCLLKHEAVAAVGVVGRADPDRTEIVVAHVVLMEGVTGDEALKKALAAHVRETYSAHAYPRDVVFCDALPMTVTGKILRRELREG
ncbi:MAG: AMP-binding protein [Paracoccaceae bacterium]